MAGTEADAWRGVLIVGSDGKELASGGVAAQREMATRIVHGWHEARRHRRRVFPVEGPDGTPVVVVVLPTPDATVLVAMEREGRDPLFELVGSVDFAGDRRTPLLTNGFVDRSGVERQARVPVLMQVSDWSF